MTEPTIKPGTRCGCTSDDCTANHNLKGAWIPESPTEICLNDAVRMVMVLLPVRDYIAGQGWQPAGRQAHDVPMCAACAEWHEAKEGAK